MIRFMLAFLELPLNIVSYGIKIPVFKDFYVAFKIIQPAALINPQLKIDNFYREINKVLYSNQ